MAEQKEQGASLSPISSGPRNLPSPSTVAGRGEDAGPPVTTGRGVTQRGCEGGGGSPWRPRSWSSPSPPTPSRSAGLPTPPVPSLLRFGKFLRASEVGAVSSAPRFATPGPQPSPTPHQPDPTLPGGRGEGGASRLQPLPGTRRRPSSGAASGAKSRRGASGGGRDSAQRAGPGPTLV